MSRRLMAAASKALRRSVMFCWAMLVAVGWPPSAWTSVPAAAVESGAVMLARSAWTLSGSTDWPRPEAGLNAGSGCNSGEATLAATEVLMTGWMAVGASVAWREPERRNTEASTANTVNRLMGMQGKSPDIHRVGRLQTLTT